MSSIDHKSICFRYSFGRIKALSDYFERANIQFDQTFLGKAMTTKKMNSFLDDNNNDSNDLNVQFERSMKFNNKQSFADLDQPVIWSLDDIDAIKTNLVRIREKCLQSTYFATERLDMYKSVFDDYIIAITNTSENCFNYWNNKELILFCQSIPALVSVCLNSIDLLSVIESKCKSSDIGSILNETNLKIRYLVETVMDLYTSKHEYLNPEISSKIETLLSDIQ